MLATCRRGLQAARCFSSLGSLTEEERYIFDLQGYLVLKNAISADDIAQMNWAIDKHKDQFIERQQSIQNAKVQAFKSNQESYMGRFEHGKFFEKWPHEDSKPFASLLAHPNVTGKLNGLVSGGYRLDHMPLLIRQLPGVEGFDLHGGNMNAKGAWNRELAYHFHTGSISCNLLAMSVQLTRTRAGEGGFCVVPGSHKANLPMPPTIPRSDPLLKEVLRQPELDPGDVVLFSEGTMHGALPWSGPSERRIALFRFAPANMAYGRGYLKPWAPSFTRHLTPEVRSVLQPPYANRVDREQLEVVLDDEGNRVVRIAKQQSRNAEKKILDQTLFDRDYF